MVADIFDEVADSEDVFDVIDSTEDTSVEKIKAEISSMLERYDRKEQKQEKILLMAELKDLIRFEISKIKPTQNIIERIVEKKTPVYLEPKVIQTPPPPPQIIKEVRVEVQTEKKDTTKYVEASKFQDLLVTIGKLETQLKETKRMAESPIVLGGSGVIGIPPPEPKPVGYVLTINDQKKAEWKVATASGGGTSTDVYTVSNVTTDRSYNATSTSVDELANVLGSLIASLQGAGVIL